MNVNKSIVMLAAALVSGTCVAKTFSKDLLINNVSNYPVTAVGDLSESIDFDLPSLISPGNARLVSMTFDTGGWVFSKYPQASLDLSVRCPSGEVDNILIVIENGNPVSVRASAFNSNCVKVVQDQTKITFDKHSDVARIDIVNK